MSKEQLGAWLAMGSGTMLFGTLMLAAVLLRVRQPVWPPIGVEPVAPLLPTVATLVLAVATFWFHKHRFEQAMLCGLLFFVTQGAFWLQLRSQGLVLSSNVFSSAIYGLTLLYSLHLLAALVLMLVLRSRKRPLGTWLWNFLAAAWLPIYFYLCL